MAIEEPIVENEKCLPCPSVTFTVVKCRRSSKILDKKSGCGYKGISSVSDPHTDPDKKYDKYKDKYGKTKHRSTSASGGESSSPPPGADSGTSGAAGVTHDQLLIDVVVSLYDRRDPYGMTGWFKNQTLSKFMKLYIIQCTSEDIAATIQIGGQPALEEYVKDGFPQHEAMEAKHITLEKNTSLESFEKINDEETGKSLYKVQYTFTFALRGTEPDHLSYYAGCFFDRQQIMEEYSLDSCTLDNTMMFCKASFINVFSGGEAISDIRIRCGRTLEEDASGITETLDDDPPGGTVGTPYFSPLCMSRDCKNNSKFIFGVDYRRLIKEKSRFGNLLNTTYLDVLNDLLSATLIRDMKIFRINARDYPGIISSTSDVGAESTEGSADLPPAGFSADSPAPKPDYLVVENQKFTFPIKGRKERDDSATTRDFETASTGDPEAGTMLGTLDEISLYYAYEPLTPMAYRHFNIGDLQIAAARKTGTYRYYTTMKIQDRILNYLLAEAKELRKMFLQLRLYYEEATKSCNYNSYTDSFYQHFIDFLYTTGLGPQVSPRTFTPGAYAAASTMEGAGLWKNPVGTLVRINKIFNFTLYPTNEDLNELATRLLYKVNPYTASPDSILEVLQFMNHLLLIIYDYLGQDMSDVSGYFDGDSAPEIKTKAIPYFIDVQHYFKERFDTGLITNVGYDYLGCSDGGLLSEEEATETYGF